MDHYEGYMSSAKQEYDWLVVWTMNFMHHFIIYGMLSFPLTFIFFKMVAGPPTR